MIGQHREAVAEIDGLDTVPDPIARAARDAWDQALRLGQRHGYRNAQATVLAPTGTIAFMMDCDTTGVEPDIALIKYKNLSGGGYFKIVNRTVPAALRRLGYGDADVEAIVGHVDELGGIEGAPNLDQRHLPIFDCAFKSASGSRSIDPLGHVRMLGAVQPFISAPSPRPSTCPKTRPSSRSWTPTSKRGSSESRRSRSTATTPSASSRSKPAAARAAARSPGVPPARRRHRARRTTSRSS